MEKSGNCRKSGPFLTSRQPDFAVGPALQLTASLCRRKSITVAQASIRLLLRQNGGALIAPTRAMNRCQIIVVLLAALGLGVGGGPSFQYVSGQADAEAAPGNRSNDDKRSPRSAQGP